MCSALTVLFQWHLSMHLLLECPLIPNMKLSLQLFDGSCRYTQNPLVFTQCTLNSSLQSTMGSSRCWNWQYHRCWLSLQNVKDKIWLKHLSRYLFENSHRQIPCHPEIQFQEGLFLASSDSPQYDFSLCLPESLKGWHFWQVGETRYRSWNIVGHHQDSSTALIKWGDTKGRTLIWQTNAIKTDSYACIRNFWRNSCQLS